MADMEVDGASEPLYSSWEAVETLPGTEFFRLYRSPAAALAIFRKRLSGLAKSYVMTLLWTQKPILVRDLDLFARPASISEHRQALKLLLQYHIFRETTVKSQRAYALTPDFARSLRRALLGAGNSQAFGEIVSLSPEQSISIAELDDYARRQWEGLLGYMVGSNASALDSEELLPPPRSAVIELLKAGSLLKFHGTTSRGTVPQITREGFAFVLQDVSTQIWALLFLYVSNGDQLGMDKVEVLSFIFLVSSMELGMAYSRKHLNDQQQQILENLSGLGIIYLPVEENGEFADYFYPTRLATTLTSDSSVALSVTNATLGSSLAPASADAGASQGFIVVETNYRVYAYTSSPLQIALLSLFVTLRSRHPNLVTGKMTKMSIGRAVRAGIDAEQIIAYLTSHAHPQMRRHAQAEQARAADQGRQVSILPATVVDQIHLWKQERDRMKTSGGFLLKDFKNQSDYEANCKYADENGVLVWKSDKKRMFFIEQAGWTAIQAFIRARQTTSSSTV